MHDVDRTQSPHTCDNMQSPTALVINCARFTFITLPFEQKDISSNDSYCNSVQISQTDFHLVQIPKGRIGSGNIMVLNGRKLRHTCGRLGHGSLVSGGRAQLEWHCKGGFKGGAPGRAPPKIISSTIFLLQYCIRDLRYTILWGGICRQFEVSHTNIFTSADRTDS